MKRHITFQWKKNERHTGHIPDHVLNDNAMISPLLLSIWLRLRIALYYKITASV